MKLTIFVIAFLCVCSVTLAAFTPPPIKACLKKCDLDYKPICAAPPGSTNDRDKKSFGSVCVMNNYNCENGANLGKIFDGECPGGGAVRLA